MSGAQASCAGLTRSSVLGCHNTIGPTRPLRTRRSAAEQRDELGPVWIELHRLPQLARELASAKEIRQ
jgi:hypothetical protein